MSGITQNPVYVQVGQPNLAEVAMTPAPAALVPQPPPMVQATPVIQVHQPSASANTFIFRPKVAEKQSANDASVPLKAGVQSAIDLAEQLMVDYQKLQFEVFDRSDAALWKYLEGVYTFVCEKSKSVHAKDIRAELIRKIRQRGGSMSTASTMTAIVVRYVFENQSRQTRSNYTIAMEKAIALEIAANDFAGFLHQYGGVGKVVEHIFDYEEKQLTFNANTSKIVREDKQSRTELMGRLYNAMAHATPSKIEYSGELNNWVPEKPQKAAKADGKEDKVDPKYQQGDFVLFVTVRDPQSGKYRVVQGNVFDRAFEAQLLGTIADRMDAGTDELANAVAGLEQQIGFTAAE